MTEKRKRRQPVEFSEATKQKIAAVFASIDTERQDYSVGELGAFADTIYRALHPELDFNIKVVRRFVESHRQTLLSLGIDDSIYKKKPGVQQASIYVKGNYVARILEDVERYGAASNRLLELVKRDRRAAPNQSPKARQVETREVIPAANRISYVEITEDEVFLSDDGYQTKSTTRAALPPARPVAAPAAEAEHPSSLQMSRSPALAGLPAFEPRRSPAQRTDAFSHAIYEGARTLWEAPFRLVVGPLMIVYALLQFGDELNSNQWVKRKAASRVKEKLTRAWSFTVKPLMDGEYASVAAVGFIILSLFDVAPVVRAIGLTLTGESTHNLLFAGCLILYIFFKRGFRALVLGRHVSLGGNLLSAFSCGDALSVFQKQTLSLLSGGGVYLSQTERESPLNNEARLTEACVALFTTLSFQVVTLREGLLLITAGRDRFLVRCLASHPNLGPGKLNVLIREFYVDKERLNLNGVGELIITAGSYGTEGERFMKNSDTKVLTLFQLTALAAHQ